MESLGFYWNHFVEIEAGNLRSILEWSGFGGGRRLRQALFGLTVFLPPLILYVGEFVTPWRRAQPKLRFGLGLDVFYTLLHAWLFLTFFGDAFIGTVFVAFSHALQAFFGITHLVAIHLNVIPIWSRVLAIVLFNELLAYLGHWLLHNVGFLWEFHKVHHSSRELDVWNAQRFHFAEQTFWPLFRAVPIAMVGFQPAEAFVTGFVLSLFSFYTHSNIRIPLGPFKYVINNPQLHIWHHAASIDPKRNVNYGDSLCVWDYLFGTAYLPAERPNLKLGFAGVEEYPTTFWGQLVAPFQAIASRIVAPPRNLLARSWRGRSA